MKTLKYFAIVAAAVFALTVTAKADLTFLGAAAFGPNNSPASNLEALSDFGVDTTGLGLCANFENVSGDTTITVETNSFLVVHYGKGKGGSAKGGSFEFFQVTNGETTVTVPGMGNVAGNDPFGHGGISSIRDFCPGGQHVPDSGTTAMLLGSALTGLGLVRRHLKR
jgi:hypothetical protein